MTTKFLDGPAAGQVLMIRRAPMFLRVVFNHGTKQWDALDQLADKPHPSETVYAYQLVENRGVIHICSRGKRGASGYFAMADYAVVGLQPDRETMRLNTKWQAWCEWMALPESVDDRTSEDMRVDAETPRERAEREARECD